MGDKKYELLVQFCIMGLSQIFSSAFFWSSFALKPLCTNLSFTSSYPFSHTDFWLENKGKLIILCMFEVNNVAVFCRERYLIQIYKPSQGNLQHHGRENEKLDWDHKKCPLSNRRYSEKGVLKKFDPYWFLHKYYVKDFWNCYTSSGIAGGYSNVTICQSTTEPKMPTWLIKNDTEKLPFPVQRPE